MRLSTQCLLSVFLLFGLGVQLQGQNVLNHLSTYKAGSFDEGAAEIVTYDAASQRLFLTNAETGSIDILSITDPANPTLVRSIDISTYGEGVNSVASANGLIAAAIEGMDQMPGKIVLFDSAGAFVADYPAGVLPDMVAFSANGEYIVAACEGEPDDDYMVDPEGSVTVVDISNGATMGAVTQINFQGYNDKKASLMNKGVRIFGPGASVAQDLEPEYVTFDPMSDSVAYVVCQENNALAVIDYKNGSVVDILALGVKDHNSGTPTLTQYFVDTVSNLPVLGTPVYNGGQPPVNLGGFSGLCYDHTQSTATEYVFYAIPDRGPNDGTTNRNSVTPPALGNLRPFKLPNYQGRIVKFTVDVSAGTVSLDPAEQIFLTAQDSVTPITGRGNAPGLDETPVTYTDANTPFGDSSYVDNNGTYFHALEYDAFGGDFEGIIRDLDGNFWMCDEYRPAIYKFSPEGYLLNRYIAQGTKARVRTTELFFSEYAEGSSNNKYFEFYNGTADTIDLDDYMLVSCSNGCANLGEFEFDNTPLWAGKKLAPQDVFVIAQPSAQMDILAKADTTFTFMPNGDDWWAILRASDSSIVDQIGESTTVQTKWDVAGVTEATGEHTLIRKHYILSGSDNWAASAGADSISSEWLVKDRPTATFVSATLGSHLDLGDETLPAVYGKRWANRGFEAIAYDSAQNIIYAFIQSPMDNPNSGVRNSDVIRILGIDAATGTPVSEYVYLLERNKDSGVGISRVDKIGDAVHVGGSKFMVLERDSSIPPAKTGKKFIFEIDLAGATNILGTPLAVQDTGMTLESMTAEQVVDGQGIQPVHKRKVLNLPTIGYIPSDKPEGLALLPGGSLAVMNDNDFGLAGAGVSDRSSLGIIDFGTNNSFDASNDDGAINIQNHPVFGFYMPDAIQAIEIDGASYIFTANEGDARDYDGYSEEARGDDLILDSTYFANPSMLQDDAVLGRLNSTTANGDIDGDGENEIFYSYGARSFSIWDALGNLVWDSGNDFEMTLAMDYPGEFNSTNDDNDSFDNRSDDKGPEPEAICVIDLDTAVYAFIGLERMGGIMVYRVDDPTNPQFVEYELNRDFSFDADTSAAGDLAPEDIKYIKASDSPNGKALIAVANEVSGTVSLYQLFEKPTVSSLEERIELDPIRVYPNPVNGNTIYFTQRGNYELFNLMGQQLGAIQKDHKMDVSSLSPGVYVVRNDKNQVGRFIKK